MNSLIKNHKRFFSLLLGLLLYSSLSAVTLRNEPLTNFVQPGEVLYATFPENCFVILDMESDNFDISHSNIEQLDKLKEAFQEVMAGRSGGSISSRTFNSSANIIDYNSSYLNGRECMNIQGKTSLQLIHCLLESPLISITGNKMNFFDSFLINTKVLNIKIDVPGSDYDIIQILFYDQPENPTVITGEIDLNNNQTTKRLIISNVKAIIVRFMWDKNLPKKSNMVEPPAVNQKSQPRLTCSQFIDKYFKKNILFSKEFIPLTFSAALLLCIAYHDIFN